MADDVVIGKAELIRKFRSMSEAVQGRSLANVALVGGNVVLNAAKDNVKEQGLIRSRNLSRSLHQEIVESSATRAVSDIGTNEDYAAIHEFGGVVRPKNAKYLAIPVGSYTGSPRKYSDLRVLMTSNGNLVLVDASKKIQYVLKSSVEIPARPYMRPAFDEKQTQVKSEMGEAFKTLILKASAT